MNMCRAINIIYICLTDGTELLVPSTSTAAALRRHPAAKLHAHHTFKTHIHHPAPPRVKNPGNFSLPPRGATIPSMLNKLRVPRILCKKPCAFDVCWRVLQSDPGDKIPACLRFFPPALEQHVMGADCFLLRRWVPEAGQSAGDQL